jgi:beta-glucosidase-like glycosyl hydrolase/CubicO group peptidase (beta-lactamase class C family)
MKHLALTYITLFLIITNPAWTQDPGYAWVDSVYTSLTREQRIAQLLVIRAWSWKDSVYNDSLMRVVVGNNVGGVCFFKGSPVQQAVLTNRMQQDILTPLMVTTDAEWGLGMRLDSAFSFPRLMTLGAIRNDSLIYEMGRLVGQACRRLGIHVNFAPVADVNNNPGNPVISFRSFGENRELVARNSILYMKGMQEEGILTTAKHFPGHGDTDSDSHYTLPVINHNRQRLDSVELYPFRELIREGAQGMMIAHLFVPCLDSTENTPTTLSKNVVTGLLKNEMGFNGYVFTDALDMQGVTKYFPAGAIEVKALQAGNDILLLPQDVPAAVKAIKTAVDSGWLSDSLLEARCKRMLMLKHKLGLAERPVISTRHLVEDLNPPEAGLLARNLIEESITVLKNELMLIPLTAIDRRKIAVLSIGEPFPTLFQETLRQYAPVEIFNVPREFTKAFADSIFSRVYTCDVAIVGIHGIRSNPSDAFGLTPEMIRLADTITRINRTILAVFGTPYALNRITGLDKSEAIVVAYQDNPDTQRAAAEVIFGGIAAKGKLPVSAAQFPLWSGETTEKTRLTSALPEAVGIPRQSLNVIDSIVNDGIEKRAFPGCQVLFANDGKVFFEQAYGHPRYEDTTEVTVQHLYDLASVTKILATTLAIMKLYDESRISLNDRLGKYLPKLKGTNKAHLHIGDVMAHQAGLPDWIPFYSSTLLYGQPDPALYQPEPSNEFPVRVAQNLYLRKDYPDSIYRRILDSPLLHSHDYKYSDLGFYLLPRVVEEITGMPFEEYLDVTFYKPLGLLATGFLPRENHDLSVIVPTEYDEAFRKQLLWGDVHDQGAAMLGGISGHAGLFGNARELAVIMQMLLQEGSYGGKQYLSPETVQTFTSVQFPKRGNRRGAGFDKPMLNPHLEGPSCKSASPLSFGHAGFTGTYVWADPAENLVYIFLSNRIYPSAENRKLSDMNIRTNIHQVVYDLLRKNQTK